MDTARQQHHGVALPPVKRRFKTLRQWLAWQQQLHPSIIDFGLERVTEALRRLRLNTPRYPVITVGGTNGKGSTVAFLDAMLGAAGYRTGAYTSPHLLRYNERIQIAGTAVDDATLCAAFAEVDNALVDDQNALTLSFFEFGTVAALRIFDAAAIDIGLLEVGLGGRLDAVNAIDADVAVITTIALDHTEWLGPDRDSIGFEKAGIFRPGRPAVCADPDPPPRLLQHAAEVGAPLYQVGRDYRYERQNRQRWRWWDSNGRRFDNLPLPPLAGEYQLANAAAALMALQLVPLPVAEPALRAGLRQARHAGRLQRILPPPGGNPDAVWLLDVAHNPQGAEVLADYLRSHPVSGRNYAIFGMLADKDAATVARTLDGSIDRWYTVPLKGSRGLSAARLARQMRQAGINADKISSCLSMVAAVGAASSVAADNDRVIVLGSLYTVAKLLRTERVRGERWIKH